MNAKLPLSLFGVLLLGACTSSKSSTPTPAADPCPRVGTVLADMRDVERDAEGISYAAFGPAPDHAPDFGRAQGVLSLLHQVWDRSRSACPDLPADAVSAVDDALATLDASIPAGDQQSSAYAGNDVHLQMAPLFEYFNPDTSVAVVRMDAVFLRVGLDAWYGDWQAFDEGLAMLEKDWAALAPDAKSKVGTCHRVAGTQTVAGDLDETLARLAEASMNQDVALAQAESDAGLLEVDILELLFDCPPDGAPPSTGLGSPCSADGDCSADQVCDLADGGGRCAPDPATTNVGAPCSTTTDCGTYERDACNNDVGDGFPGGYCSLEPCDDVQVCPPGGTCVALPFETPACMKSCTVDSDCRVDEGYLCQLFPTTPPIGFGPTDHACAFPCSDDDECTAPLKCDVASGKCTP